ncbi:hypothetical protein FJY93_05010, partial [Candidatus Kaiserbacteria bacterium]|nr:hypothetical protein [Candidatus Kaiserbacteria bacterium]
MVARYIPAPGDIVWTDFSPTKGHEQSGRRPAVVITVRSYAKASGICTVCPVTSHAKGYFNEVPFATKDVAGVVLVDQHRTLDFEARSLVRAGKVSPQTLIEIRRRTG